MAKTVVWETWAPLRWVPFIEGRTVAVCHDRDPTTPIDVSLVWREYRLRRRRPAPAKED